MRSKTYLVKGQSLEAWLKKRSPKCFPAFDKTRGEISLPKRYDYIKTVLLPYHKAVEKGALLKSAKEWEKEIKTQLKSKKPVDRNWLKSLEQACPIVYLNNHGEGHVDKVIQKCSELLEKSQCGLNAYEGYLLLCAIQFHDVGNIFGREEHEKKCKEILDASCKEVVKDSAESLF